MNSQQAKYFKHATAIVEAPDDSIGQGSRIWAFAHILPGAVMGENCNICDHVFIENDVIIGDRVTIKCGVQLWDGIRLDNDVFIGPNATFTNDKFPRSKQPPSEFQKTAVGEGASIGAGAVLLPGIKIGSRAMIGAGSVVTRSVPANAIVAGNPARITGYVDTFVNDSGRTFAVQKKLEPKVSGVKLIAIKHIPDIRGSLCATEFAADLPFQPKRAFLVYDVPSVRVRGEHAHRVCAQFLLCVHGAVSVIADDGNHREEYLLDSPKSGIFLPPRTWGTQYKYSTDAVLLVLASHEYDATDYIRDYEEYLGWIQE